MRRFDVESTYDTTVDTLWDLLQDASLLTKLTKFPKVRLVGDGASVEGNEVKLFVGPTFARCDRSCQPFGRR